MECDSSSSLLPLLCGPSFKPWIDSLMEPHGANVLTPAPGSLLTHDLWPFTKEGVSLNRDFPAVWQQRSTKSRWALLTRALMGTMGGQTERPLRKTALPVTGRVHWKNYHICLALQCCHITELSYCLNKNGLLKRERKDSHHGGI